MACDTRTLPNQTLTQRKAEVREAIERLAKLIAAGQVKVVIGRQGAVAFEGWNEPNRGRVSDGCAYRLLSLTGNAMARMAIAKAEQLAGRGIDKQVVAQGWHRHGDGPWHKH